jgi:hypothetical protein
MDLIPLNPDGNGNNRTRPCWDGNGYKPVQFSLLISIPTHERKKTLRQVSHLVLWVEVLPQTCRVKKIHRVIHINFLTACYNKKSVLNNTNIHKL